MSMPRCLPLVVSAALLFIGLSGCDSDEGSSGAGAFAGVYEITSHQADPQGCEALVAVEDPSTCSNCSVRKGFFKIKEQSFFGQTVVTLVECESATVCDDADDEPGDITLGGVTFSSTSADRMSGELNASSYFEGSCTFLGKRYVAEKTEAGLTLTTTQRQGNPEAADEDACFAHTDSPPADDTLECTGQEVIEATKL